MALATNGSTLIIGCRHGLTIRLRHEVPTSINTNCSAHLEALSTCDAFIIVPKLLILDQFTNKVYRWVERSSNQQKRLKCLLIVFDWAFSRSCARVDFILYANIIRWFPSGRYILVPSSYNLLVSIYASSCDRCVHGTI